ncbi:helix-turn-helix domain-containing protein [Streptomyces coelicoflavus]|uniref:helix-turn-helix domain-containing protein n=1 Tax=Streptomyces coelicoflavus TaxID=285562 RepID=UPI00362ABA36
MKRFEDGQSKREIAAALRVSERSVERWRRQRRERGEAGSCRGEGLGGRGLVGRDLERADDVRPASCS